MRWAAWQGRKRHPSWAGGRNIRWPKACSSPGSMCRQQPLLAMALSSVLLLGAMLHQGSTLVGLFYVPAMLLHLITYLLVAVLTGYVADSRRYEREAAHWQAAQHEERLAVLKRLYDENMEVKNHLYHQIVNSDDSIGRLYRIIRNLDSVEPENIFTQAAAVTAQVLDVRDIAVYVVGNDQRYLRQKVRLGRLANQLPRSLRVADCRYLQSVLHEKAVYINRELAADAPDMAATIIHQGRVIAVVEVFGMRFEQWSLHQQNLLSITVRLISSSMGRAYQYESEIQARRYWGNTRILQAKEFDKIIAELKVRRQLQGDLPLAMLRVDMTGLDYQELDSRLSGAIRNEDFVGLWADRVYVLLPDAEEEVTAMVDLLGSLHDYVQVRKPGFGLLANGGAPLYLPYDGNTPQNASKMLQSLDGQLVESVFYGSDLKDGEETSKENSDYYKLALQAGFDGAFLDVIDVYQYFCEGSAK